MEVNLSAGTATGTGGIASIENVIGGRVSLLTGDSGNNILTATGGGNVVMRGLGGDDTYIFLDGWGTALVEENPAEGTDTLDFSSITTDVNFTFNGTTITVTDGTSTATSDYNVENFIGSATANNVFDFGASPTIQHLTLTAFGTSRGFQGQIAGIGTFDNADEVIGSSLNGDSLTGMDAAADWILDIGYSQYTVNPTLDFIGFENLLGGSDSDTFTFTDGATLPGAIDGQAGLDTLDYTNYATARTVILTSSGSIDGFNGTEASIGGCFRNIDDIVGSPSTGSGTGSGTGGDTLTGPDTDNTWAISNIQSQISNIQSDLTFTAIETLVGGTGNDTLTFAGFATARDIQIAAVGTVDGFDITESHFAGIFQNINTIIGSPSTGSGDTLTALDTDNTWEIGDPQSAIRNSQSSLDFTAIENLVGGTGTDTLIGPNTTNTWAISNIQSQISNPQSTWTFTAFENLTGGAGTDTIDYSAYGSGVNINLLAGTATGLNAITGIENITGTPFDDILSGDNLANQINAVGGSDTLTGSGSTDGFAGTINGKMFDNLNILHAGSGNDTLTGLDAASNWVLDIGYLRYISTNTLDFTNVETLIGGSEDDTLDFSAFATARDMQIAAVGAVDGFDVTESHFTGIFQNINTIIGSPSTGSGDTLTGPDTDNTWELGDPQSVIRNPQSTLTFTAIENLVGGAGDDTLDLSAFGSTRDVTLTGAGSTDGFAGTATDLGGTFDNVDILVGGTGNDTLTGPNTDNTWAISNIQSQISNLQSALDFTAFETLIGGSEADTFNINANVVDTTLRGGGGDDSFVFADGVTLDGRTPAIDGGAGDDTLDYSAYTVTLVDVDIDNERAMNVNNNARRGIRSIENVIGGQTNIIYGDEGDNILQGGSGNDILVGRGGNDTYIFEDGWGIDEVRENPGEGNDTIDLSRVTQSLSLTFNGETVHISEGANTVDHTGSDGISQVENFLGGQVGDTFDIVGTSNKGTLRGGPGDDVFAFDDDATLSGPSTSSGQVIAGGAGADTLDYQAYTTTVTVDLSTGSATGVSAGAVGQIATVENILGGDGDDTLTGDAADNVIDGGPGDDTLAGLGGDDVYRFRAGWGVDTVLEDPGAGDDALDFSSLGTGLNFALGSIIVTDGLGNIATHAEDNVENGHLPKKLDLR